MGQAPLARMAPLPTSREMLMEFVEDMAPKDGRGHRLVVDLEPALESGLEELITFNNEATGFKIVVIWSVAGNRFKYRFTSIWHQNETGK